MAEGPKPWWKLKTTKIVYPAPRRYTQPRKPSTVTLTRPSVVEETLPLSPPSSPALNSPSVETDFTYYRQLVPPKRGGGRWSQPRKPVLLTVEWEFVGRVLKGGQGFLD